MSENEATSDQDDVSFIRTDDMVCLQCSETGERVCLAAEGFGNRHCFLEPIANKNYPPEMPSCVFVIEQALSVRALQEMVTAESSDSTTGSSKQPSGQMGGGSGGGGSGGGSGETSGDTSEDAAEISGSDAPQLSAIQLTSKGASDSAVGGGNKTLLYGHAVLLRHLHSGMYLATLSICSSSDKLAFDVGLKDIKEIGESCWWTVHPGSKQRSEGEKVRVGDDLILVSVATERYLHYTTSDQPASPPPMASASAAAVMSTMGSSKQAIVNASFHSTHWSIAPFGTGLSRVKNVGYVFGGQVLRLLHGGDECLTISAQQAAQSEGAAQQSLIPAQVNMMANNQSSNVQLSENLRNSVSAKHQIDVIYEGGAVMNQARSLWRLDLIRTRWSGGFVQCSNALRLRHITTGKYLGINEQNQLCLLTKIEATVERTAFCLRLTKDDSKGSKGDGDDKDEEVIGLPMIKYGDTSFFIQHIDTQMWLSYRSYETKKRGIGRVEEKQAILSAEGKMDDCLEFSRSQEEEAKTARVIRKCDALFSKFIRILDHVQQVALLEKESGLEAFTNLQGDPYSEPEGRPLHKKRPSVAASAVAAAALSSLAPLFSTSGRDSPKQIPQDKDTSGQHSPPTSSRLGRLDINVQPNTLFPYQSQIEMSKCLEDLIDYFAPPEEGCDHEQEQNRLRALRNRQDLFQEEGILNLILDAIDKINLISGQGLLVLLLGEESSSTWEAITGYLYQLLAAIIKDNHTNCAQFAQSHRLNWLFSRLSSQQASEGTGMLDVLHYVLVDSPEALNMLKESHIKVLISLLEKHGRDPKVLNVLCSLCVSNGVAIRSSQNTITNNLLPGRNLLLQTRLVDHVASMKPNIYVARVDKSAMYHRWYYEVVVDHIEMINNLSPHLRVGWANTKGYLPYPGSGLYWGTNGVGDDFYSYGFDGQYLWTAGRPTLVRIPPTSTMTRQEVLNNQSVDYQNQQHSLLESYANQQNELVSQNNSGGNAPAHSHGTADGLTSLANIDAFTHSSYLRLQKNDVIGCLIDLSVPSIQFTINGKQIFGFFKNFNVTNGGIFHPVMSFSARVSCRFLFGSNQGELRYRPPAGFSPIVEVLLPNQEVAVESCFSFGDMAKQTYSGPQITPDCIPQMVMDLIFIPKVIDTQNIDMSNNLEMLRDSLAENMHELWSMSRIEDGWIYGEEHDEQSLTHPYIAPFAMLPPLCKKYKLDLATKTIKTIIGLGYKISPSQSQDGRKSGQGSLTNQRVKTYRLPSTPYMQPNGYKPAPLDLSNSELTPKLNHLVELLAENIHNIWAAEKISLKWTYRRRDPLNDLGEDYNDGRSCHLLPYKYVDDEIKLKNRQSALETVFTIIAYNHHIEPALLRDSHITADPLTPTAQDTSDQTNLMAPSPSPGGGGLSSKSPSRPVSANSALIGGSNSQADTEVLTGHEVVLNNAREVGLRHYRAEKTYAVHSGRWYYEVEIGTLGHIQIGWANLCFKSDSPSLGCDENSWAYDCHTGRKVHASNYESFGHVASVGDVIGCMLDLNDRTISYSLNGKLMLDYLGNEMAFSNSDLALAFTGGCGSGGFVPAVSLGVNQRVRLCFGQDVEQLRFFTDYGLQEGYHPFCVNMHKPITLWYNKREPNFVNIDDLDPINVNVEITRIPPGSDSPPALKIAYKQFESQERANWEYLRLSLPVTINSELIDETDKIAKMQEIQAHQLCLAYSREGEHGKDARGGLRGALTDESGRKLRHPARLEQHMLQSGFSMADIKDLQRSYENPDSGSGSNKHESSFPLKQTLQRRHQLVKTRSVDDHSSKSSSMKPSLAVPSFTEAQKMMTAEKSKASLLKRRNTGFNLLRGSSSSLDNIAQEAARQAETSDNMDQTMKTTRSKSTFKSIFGSMRSKAMSGEARSRSLSRQFEGDDQSRKGSRLNIPTISIQTDQFGASHGEQDMRLRSMSRSDSFSNISQHVTLQNEASTLTSPKGLVRRLSRVGQAAGITKATVSQQQQPAESSTQTKSYQATNSINDDFEAPPFDLQRLDSATLEQIEEYYYGVRIFPGQEPSHVLCGWITSHFKQENLSNLKDIQHCQIVQSTSLITGQAEICERRECYLLNAGQLYKELYPSITAQTGLAGEPPTSTSGATTTTNESSSRSNRGMLIGCHVDTSTGVLSFTIDGKPTKYKVNVEAQTKLYPGIFFQATTGDCLQFELSRTASTLPLSSAILSLTPKHVNPQCPPRLKVQTLQTCSWSRVPNVSLRPNSLKLSESRGWSMLADDPLAMLAVHIPEENRCLDVLELIEHEKLLRFHSNTLILYGALCAQGNHKVAHIICSYVDQRQLLYAINSDYLSGGLRRGFADLLIALHLEFHAYGRHLTQNEFIVPITKELSDLYGEDSRGSGGQNIMSSGLVHSFSRIECVSIRTEMNMSPIGFDLSSIDGPSGTNLVKILSTPYFPIDVLKKLVFQALDEAVFKGNLPIRDLPGGSNENLFVPLLKLADRLLLIGCITNQELGWLLNLIDPETFERPKVEQGVDKTVDTPNLSGLSFLNSGANAPSSVWKPTILEQPMLQGGARANMSSKGLLQMRKLDEHVKLVICHILHHLLDFQLRHRIESIMAFSVNFVGQLQTDQRRRYDGIKTSNLPSHLTARKTREFRCTPREQMRYILDFKNNTDADELNSSPSSETLRNTLKNLHSSMMKQIKVIIESDKDDAEGDGDNLKSDDFYARQRLQQQQDEAQSSFSKLLRIVKLVKLTLTSGGRGIESHLQNQNGQFATIIGHSGYKELKFIKEIVKTVIKWAEESTIEKKQLVRQMFHLLLRCYNGVGELIEALNNSYVIGEKSKQDVIDLLQVLSKVRALLAVQMGPAEEEVMRDCLWTLVNNVVFFQHPDLIRILRVHENVMHVMMNTLNKRSRAAQSASSSSAGLALQEATGGGQPSAGQSQTMMPMQRQRTQSIPGSAFQQGTSKLQGATEATAQVQEDDQEDDISKMVVSCCRFLCFFCRSSAKNQKAMFEHLGFLLENSNILLSRPSLRGSTPLDVAYSSLMENHELVLALRESYLEKIAIYLSRCGLQSNQELLDKGYPDVGWDPVEGERYLDFLRFCVWVNGESVEENSNLVIRLLIRRPECLGPALRGEGPGLFAAIKDAIVMADSIHTEQQNARRQMQLENGGVGVDESGQDDGDEGDEDLINMGSAILNFYCALVDLLGRCAPDLVTIGQGKHESIRARSILKSLVPLQDLKSAISLKFSLVNPQYAKLGENDLPFATAASTFMPNHKQSLVLFLERVYGIEDQETFFSLLEEAFLPDMRAATMLERCQHQPLSSRVSAEFSNQPFRGGDSGGVGDSLDSDDSPENEMTLALNRYLGNSAIPLLIRESSYFKNAENFANLLEPTLHTVYRLSKVKILTKGQRESVSDFLISLTREMQPHQLLKLLRKLTVDVAVLNESTTVALRLLTLHYERCSKYYGYTGSAQTSASGVFGTATEEERRLTMVLFTNIFDSLSLMDYDPELFENALPCLNALACALPPDYSLTESREFSTNLMQAAAAAANRDHNSDLASQSVGPYMPQPVDTHNVELNSELRRLAQRFSEHFHDAWASRKLDRDWTYGEQYNFKNKTHPRLKPYALLTRHERERYLEPIEEAMKALIAMGWVVNHVELDGSSRQRDQPSPSAGQLARTPSRSDMTSPYCDNGSNSSPITDPSQRREMIQNYNPQPVDTSNLSLSRELQNLAERSAENAHDLWAKKMMEDWEMKLRATTGEILRLPIMLHPLMVPYDLLTDKEKRKNRYRSQELLKYMLFEGYKVYRPGELGAANQQSQSQQFQRGRINSRAGTDSNYNTDISRQLNESSKRRFAYSILDKLLSYTDTVMVKLELLKPSANFSRRSSFKQSDRDVKFFSKVVLPLIERYFTAHREFFLTYGTASPVTGQGGQAPPVAGSSASPSSQITSSTQADEMTGLGAGVDSSVAQQSTVVASSTSPGMGFASIKEKEMLATLFTKFASILRNKLSVLGPDAKIFVRCLQVLTRALDARSLSEQSPDFIKTSMLTFFNKTAQDLSQCVFNLQARKYDAVRGTTMRISGSLYHVHLGILPTLTALFDHLASSESGKYILLDDIQVACQKILQSLYVLGTRIQIAGNHEFSRKELERHRQSYGNCLAAFAAAFPIAFLELELLRFNRFSHANTRQHQSALMGTNLTVPTGRNKIKSAAELEQRGSSGATASLATTSTPPSEMQASLPSLEELMKLVSKFVQTGKSYSAVTGSSGSSSASPLSLTGSNQSKPGGIYVASSSSAGSQSQITSSLQAGGSKSASGPAAKQRALMQSGKIIPADNDAAIIEVIVPMLCSYLPFWYSQGPEAPLSARTLGAGNGSTNVTFKHLNDLLKDIIHLIRRQVGLDDGNSGSSWMVTIAAHASQIIIQSPETNLLSESFLPLSTKIAQRAESIYHREELMRGYLKSAAEDTTAIEEKIQEEFHILVRDIYAFYPLLIKYVDYKKSTWLKSKAQVGPIMPTMKQQPQQRQIINGQRQAASLIDDSEISQQLEEEQNKPEQLLFQQVATVFDIWSNSQYFRREEQNFISQHEIDNMALIMQASNRPGRTFFQKTDQTQGTSGGRKKNKRRQGEKRDRDREVASSLLVVALKRLLPIGMNLFEGRERELVQHVKERFLKKDSQSRIEELVRLQLTQPYQVDPSDEFCWQHYLYSRLGAQNSIQQNQRLNQSTDETHHANGHSDMNKDIALLTRSNFDHYGGQQQYHFVVDSRIISRIVDMARVFYGLHIIDHPNLQQKADRRSRVSTQRRRVVIACFRMTSLHSLPRHRAINIFLKSYRDTWLLDEDFGQEKLIEDLTQTFEQAEMKINGDESSIPKNDPLCQLIMTLSRQATTEHGSASTAVTGLNGQSSGIDRLYLQFADIFRMSCGGDEDEDEDDNGGEGGDSGSSSSNDDDSSDQQDSSGDDSGYGGSSGGDDEGSKSEGASSSSIHEQEMEKQRLLFQQSRLSDRGVAEMILLYISAFSRYQTGGIANASAVAASGSGGAGAHNLSQHTPMILSTLKLGISILRGGNVEVQRRMLKHLKDKKDVGFFTSIQTLMNSCSVLDLDAFERNQKAEALGVRSEGTVSEKNMYDAEFTCKLFRFFQLLCEGHNLEFQNYLRTQAGNTTTVNVVISTVDYLLRLQESIMDFYWHYSSKDIIDPSGTENFIKAITIAKQVFCTLTESIQGPCPMNQQALAHSRLWHAVGGFLFLFAHMQDKLSRNSSQLNLLIELLDLQKEMVIMMLSMLEGNVVNGTIGKQMVETLVESSGNVEIILKFFDMFLKLPRLTSSTNFQEYDKTGSGWISPTDLRKAMEQHKIYTPEETQYLLSCCEPNHDGMIDYREFIDRFHQPAKDIGFNLAVLLTNLAEHITNEPRLQRFLETASTVLNYFEPYLGRIEIMGSSKRIERVYFEIKESTLDQWAKPQIQESKRAFFYSIVTEGDGKEKLEAFVNFCEDTIFEMQHASNILGEDEEEPPTKANKYPFDAGSASESPGSGDSSEYMPLEGRGSISRMAWLRLGYDGLIYIISLLAYCFGHLRPSKVRRRIAIIRSMTYGQIFVSSIKMIFHLWLGATRLLFNGVGTILKSIFKIMINDGGLGKTAHQTSLDSLGTKDSKMKKPIESAYTSSSMLESTISPAVSASARSSQANVYSMAARTELITAPSVMTASVADVVSISDTNLVDRTHDESSGSNHIGVTTIHEKKEDLPQQVHPSMSPVASRQDGDQIYLGDLGLVDEALITPTAQKAPRRKGLGFKLSQLTNYNQKIVSFLARNFYRIKLLALVTAFVINFILLFYKVSVWSEEAFSGVDKSSSLSLISTKGFLSDSDSSSADATALDTDERHSSFQSKLDTIEEKVRRSIAKYQGSFDDDEEEDNADEGEGEADDNDDRNHSNDSDNDDDEEEDEDVVDTESNNEKKKKLKEEGDEAQGDKDSAEDDEGEATDVIEYVVMEEKYYYLQPILTFLASIHSLFSLCMLIAYYHLKVPLVIFKREKEIARKLEFEGLYITDEPDSENWWNGHWDRLVISASSFPVNYWDKFVKKRVREKYREQYDYESLSNLLGMDKRSSSSSASSSQNQSKLKSMLFSGLLSGLFKVDWRYQLWKAGVTLTDQSFQYQLGYLVFSLAGHFNAFFFAAHLLDVAVGFKKLQTILQSVTHNGKQLVLTVMLLTIVVYIYTVLAFNFFRKFYIQGDDSPDPKCHSMMTCFVYHLYQGVRSGGGIGDVIEAPDGDDYEVWRIVFDITFFFFVIVILLAIIQGLIIDAFGELRDQLLTVASDMESNCFICGIGKDVLDKVPRGFDIHVQKEHNLANYMFFLMHLINKPDTDYTGQETYVWELYQRRCWDFFPVGECFRTQSEEEADAKPSKD